MPKSVTAIWFGKREAYLDPPPLPPFSNPSRPLNLDGYEGLRCSIDYYHRTWPSWHLELEPTNRQIDPPMYPQTMASRCILSTKISQDMFISFHYLLIPYISVILCIDGQLQTPPAHHTVAVASFIDENKQFTCLSFQVFKIFDW